MRRPGPLVLPSCPRCNTSPYPHGVACKTCGLVGEERQDYPLFIRGLLYSVVAALGLGVIGIAVAIASFAP